MAEVRRGTGRGAGLLRPLAPGQLPKAKEPGRRLSRWRRWEERGKVAGVGVQGGARDPSQGDRGPGAGAGAQSTRSRVSVLDRPCSSALSLSASQRLNAPLPAFGPRYFKPERAMTPASLKPTHSLEISDLLLI